MSQPTVAGAPKQSAPEDSAILEALLEHSENPLVYLDRDFNFVRVNRAYAEAGRRAVEDFIGRNHFELYPNEENQRIFERVRDTGEPAVWREKPFVYPDMPERGVTYWDWTLTAVKDDAGAVAGLAFSLVDVTEKVRARNAVQEREAQFRALLEHSPDIVVRYDRALRCAFANVAAARQVARSPEEMLGKTLAEMGRPSQIVTAMEQAVREVLGSGESRRVELHVSTEGSERWFEAQLVPERDVNGEVVSVLNVARDITERKRTEAEHDRLLAEAERASWAKDLFLATLSHELRTPVTAILMRAELLLEETDPDAIGRSTQAILRSARTQAQLIDDLLDISRVVSGKLELRTGEVALAPIVERAIEHVREVAQDKGVALWCEIDLQDDASDVVVGDARRLQQIVWNLLTNAIKFTPAGGEVVVRLERREGQLVVSVQDDGIGISSEFLPRIFDMFSQADASTTRAKGGLGLGLALAHRLVELHHGTIKAESAGTGQGAVFTVTLPACVSSGPPSEETVAPILPPSAGDRAGRLDGVDVLVVDDEAATREALVALLRGLGARVAAAASAAEAMRTLPQVSPDVLLCDIAMPEEDGYQLMRRIRALPPDRGGATPAVALTALATNADARQALASGYQVHLVKPTEAGLLVATILRLVRRAGERVGV